MFGLSVANFQIITKSKSEGDLELKYKKLSLYTKKV